MGYSWGGTQFSNGQGQNSFANLSPFESAGASNPESITGGLASGTFGKSASQQPTGGGAINALSLPQLQLPMAQVAAQQASINGDAGGGMATAGAPSAGSGIADTAIGGASKAIDLLGGNLGQQTSTPGYAEQRAGERTDYSNATGSPGGIPQLGTPATRPTLPSNAPLPSLSDVFGGMNGSAPSPVLGAPGLNPASTVPQGIMPGTSDVLGGVNAGETSLAAPGGSAQFALGNGVPGATDWGGVAQGGLGALGGLFNLFQGAEQGNVGGIGAGGLQTIGGLTSILQNSPGLAASLGLDSSGAALGGIGGAAGGIGGLYSLYQGIKSGDPVQMASGLLSAYTGGASVYGAITGTTAPGILTGLATIAPETTAAVASALTGTEVAATAGAEAISGAISAAAAAYALPVAALIQAVMDTIAESERQRVQNSGFLNNPIKGALYSASTQGVGTAQSALDELTKQGGAGGLGGLSTFDIANTLGGSLNNLMPYYDTAQGGRGPIRASDTITGAGPDWSAKPWGGGLTPEQYTANFTKAQGGMVDLVNELLKRGVTYEQLGHLPGISPDWVQQNLDMPNPVDEYYNRGASKYDVEGQNLLNRLGGSVTNVPVTAYQSQGEGGMELPTGQIQQYLAGVPLNRALTNQDIFHGAMGSSGIAPDSVTHAAALVNDMYGGPLWTAMAKMGVGGQDIQNLIQQHFDPWVNARTATGNQLSQMVTPIVQSELYQQTGVGGATPGAAPTAYYDQLPGGGNNAAGLPTRTPYADTFWSDMTNQRAGQDQTVQALRQYMQQLSQLQGQLPQLGQAAQTMGTGGLDPALLAAIQRPQQQGAPGFSGGNGAFNPGGNGGGIDLQALLKQLGYAA